MDTEEQLNKQICMDVNEQILEQILADVTFSLDIDDDVYQQILEDFRIKRLRYKMDGNRGIHIGYKDNKIQDGD